MWAPCSRSLASVLRSSGAVSSGRVYSVYARRASTSTTSHAPSPNEDGDMLNKMLYINAGDGRKRFQGAWILINDAITAGMCKNKNLVFALNNVCPTRPHAVQLVTHALDSGVVPNNRTISACSHILHGEHSGDETFEMLKNRMMVAVIRSTGKVANSHDTKFKSDESSDRGSLITHALRRLKAPKYNKGDHQTAWYLLENELKRGTASVGMFNTLLKNACVGSRQQRALYQLMRDHEILPCEQTLFSLMTTLYIEAEGETFNDILHSPKFPPLPASVCESKLRTLWRKWDMDSVSTWEKMVNQYLYRNIQRGEGGHKYARALVDKLCCREKVHAGFFVNLMMVANFSKDEHIILINKMIEQDVEPGGGIYSLLATRHRMEGDYTGLRRLIQTMDDRGVDIEIDYFARVLRTDHHDMIKLRSNVMLKKFQLGDDIASDNMKMFANLMKNDPSLADRTVFGLIIQRMLRTSQFDECERVYKEMKIFSGWENRPSIDSSEFDLTGFNRETVVVAVGIELANVKKQLKANDDLETAVGCWHTHGITFGSRVKHSFDGTEKRVNPSTGFLHDFNLQICIGAFLSSFSPPIPFTTSSKNGMPFSLHVRAQDLLTWTPESQQPQPQPHTQAQPPADTLTHTSEENPKTKTKTTSFLNWQDAAMSMLEAHKVDLTSEMDIVKHVMDCALTAADDVTD
eukprot:m.263888 g.263888  ORF g.263888 m.263888 type:complete len:690 (+) comp52809_c0_seq1:243-2312(+)